MVDSAGSLEKSITTSILNNAKVCTKVEVLNQSLAMNPLLFTTKNQLFSRNRASLANLISTQQVIKTIILKVVILAGRYVGTSLCVIFIILVSHENVKKCVLGGCTITSKTKTNVV